VHGRDGKCPQHANVVIGKGKRPLGIGRCTWKDIQRRIVEKMTLSFGFQKKAENISAVN
jgi:hypothetical protein